MTIAVDLDANLQTKQTKLKILITKVKTLVRLIFHAVLLSASELKSI